MSKIEAKKPPEKILDMIESYHLLKKNVLFSIILFSKLSIA